MIFVGEDLVIVREDDSSNDLLSCLRLVDRATA